MSDNRFEAPAADLDHAHVGEMRYAGFWIRVVASIIDTVWQAILLGGLAYLFFGQSFLEEDPYTGGIGVILVQYLLPAIIIIGFWIYFGATPGKMVFGLKICKASDGSKATAGQYIGRYAGYWLSAIALFIGFFWVAFDKRKQGWHDKLAKTVVLKTR